MRHSSRHTSRLLSAYGPAIILAAALIGGIYLLDHGVQSNKPLASVEAKYTDMSPSGLEVVPASGGSEVSYQVSYAVCTAGQWDPSLCRRCTAAGQWAANCTDWGGGSDPGFTATLWCNCSQYCTGSKPASCFPAPTAYMAASPSSITSGNYSALSFSSTDATTCAGTNFATGGVTAGIIYVYPTSNTTYTVTCSGAGGSAQYSVTVNVSPAVCSLPWGGSINSGQSTTAYQASSVAYLGTCTSQTRTCTNGTLSGTYQYQSCTVASAASCSLPWGGSINSGQSTTAYQASSVPYGSSCTSQTRSCNNGSLSGTYTNQSCTVQSASSCSLPWGGSINSGQSTTAYQASSVPYGSSCTSQTRSCTNGTLGGSYQYQSCSVSAATAPTCSVSLSPNPIARGASTLVSWTSANATSFTLTTMGPQTPNTSGSASHSPSSNTNYGGTAIGPGGSITCPATLTVTQPTADINVLKL